MVKKQQVFFLGLAVLILSACNNDMRSSKDSLPSSSGKYGEVLIVVDTSLEKGETGRSIDAIFREPLLGLPQNESQFRAVTVPHAGFKSILKRSRNLVLLKRKNGSKTGIKLIRDIWAKPQLMIKVSASSDAEIARILDKNKESIRDYFNEEELKRLQAQFKGSPQKELMETVRAKLGLNMIVPPGFVQMKSEPEGLWLKKEKTIGQHQVIQGLFLYSEAYDREGVFEADSMIFSQNKFTYRFIEGTRDSSYMQVYKTYKPDQREISLNGVYAVEYRGLWNMANDFMGGPFIHYIFVDEAKSRVLHVGGFVFAPKFNKREYLREVEAILKTITIEK